MGRKKKISDDREVQVALDNWVSDDVHTGTPSMALLPAANYMFKAHKKQYKITIPRSGEYNKLCPELFKESDGKFSLYDVKNKVMYIPAISKVLFAANKYPKLEQNQLFAPIALVFRKNEVDIIGQVIEMLEPDDVGTTVGD